MALTKEDLQAIGALLEPIRADIAELKAGQQAMQADVEQLKEYAVITRDGVNTLMEWVEEAAGVVEIRFPVRRRPE